MNKLEEIKNNFDKREINHGYGLSSDDIEYLLNEVERLNREVSDLTDACRQWREHAEGKRDY